MKAFFCRTCPLLVLVFACVAHADDEPEADLPAGSQPEYGVMPMASEGSDKRLEKRLSMQQRPKYDRRSARPKAVLGLLGGVALFVGDDADRDIVRPGGGFAVSAGADLGYFAPELSFGYMAVPLEEPGISREPLQRLALEMGGRLQFPNNTPVVPYLGAAFAVQWWKFNAFPPNCVSFFACSTGNDFRFAPGMSFRTGLTISFSRSVSFDVGLRYGMTFQGNNAFPTTRHWLEPSFGFRFWI
ncbi:MAG: hypothetical protein AAF997_13375 [Myxococcota bacterium]